MSRVAFKVLRLAALSVIIAFSTSSFGWAQDVYRAKIGVAVPIEDVTQPNGSGSLGYNLAATGVTPSLMHKLSTHGAQLVRLPINPLPLLQASDAARASALQQVLAVVDAARQANLAVIVDMHFWSPDPPGALRQALDSSAGVQRYTLALQALAQGLSQRPHGQVALELLNEPPRCDVPTQIVWPNIQPGLVAAVRAVSRNLPLVLTGCGGQLDGLLQLPMTPYAGDHELIYTFHFYEPYVFTHQNAGYGLPPGSLQYPPQLTAQTFVSPDQLPMVPSQKRKSVVADIRNYRNHFNGSAAVNARFALIRAWAAANGVPPSHIFVGEFGAVIGVKPADETPRPSELAWLSDVSTAAQANGFSRAFWTYPTRRKGFDYDPSRDFIRGDVAQAIGLRP